MPKFNIDKVMQALARHFDEVKTPIVDLIQVQTKDPFKVLVATILSARTKDETTAKASAALFAQADTPEKLDKLSEQEINSLIFPVGFHNTKAKHLKQLPGVLNELFDGRFPRK